MSTVSVINVKHPSSASNNLVLDNAGNATFAGTAAMASSFLRNRIINGGFDVWQRGTSFASPAGGAYLADRYFTFFTSITSFSRSTDAPTGFRYSAQIVGTDVSVYQKIEDLNCDNLAGGAVTFSFWARSVSGTGNLAVQLLSPTAPNNYTSFTVIYNASISASPSASWTRYTVTANVDANIVNGLQVQIYRGGAATTLITGIQLEAGTAATAFERRQFGQELALCQRYFQKTFNQDTAPAQGISGGGAISAPGSVANTSFNASWWFACPMRTSPTVVTFSPDNASANWSDQGGFRPTATVITVGQASIGIRGEFSVLAGGYYTIHATVSAEL